MACGMTPSLARMLEQVAQEKETKARGAEQQLSATAERVARTKQRLADLEQTHAKQEHYDWTKTYEKWDAWEDPEELARQEQEARERSERAAREQLGCNHDHSAEQKLMDMTTQEKLDACDEFRQLGNLFFQHGQYQRAAYHYHKALVHFEYIFPDTDAETERHDALKLKVLLNFAACRLKTGHLEDVVQHADQALALDAANVKALYRRAQAHRLRDNFDRAMQDINKAIEIAQAEDASDPLLVQEKALLQAKMLAYKLKSKQVSSAMFRSKESKTDRHRQHQQRSSALPDASVLRLNLQAKQSVDTAPEIAAFDSWQPCCLGLQELESVLAKLT
ncbi:hypothetical protein FI667_g13598, partial [Globisporangium splendens]